jgi:hypothetical protein
VDGLPAAAPDISGAAPAPAGERPLFCGVTAGGGLPARFSGHSLRRGLLTEAGDRQLPLIDLMRQSRHVSVQTALSYVEARDAWHNNITNPCSAPAPVAGPAVNVLFHEPRAGAFPSGTNCLRVSYRSATSGAAPMIPVRDSRPDRCQKYDS